MRPKIGHAFESRPFAEVKLNPDGGLVLTLLDEFISVAEAAKIIGISESTLFRMLDTIGPDRQPLFRVRRPSQWRILVSLQSVQEFNQKTESDPDFWKKCNP